MQNNQNYRVYGSRWLVLAVFMFINLTIQILWISYAPITGIAASFYKVSDLQIGFLAMTFMIAFIPLSIPVSWLIDTIGFKKSVSIGAVIMGIFGLARGFPGLDYKVVLLCTIGIAIAQPFLLNAWTKIAANWFAMNERATAVGLVTLSGLFGTALGMVITPILVETMSISAIQLIYGVLAAFSSLLFIIFSKDKPPTAPCPSGMETRSLMLDGLKTAIKVKDFWLYILIFFIGMGIFNGITTWVETIIRSRGFSAIDAGTMGAVLLAGGLLGAVIIPTISDRIGKRTPLLRMGFLLAIPGLVGVTFAQTHIVLFTSAFFMGFFLISAGPIGMQYAAEITYPTPEGTSNGLIQLFGQASVVFVYIMEALKDANGEFFPAMMLSIGLLVVSSGVTLLMKESGQKIRSH